MSPELHILTDLKVGQSTADSTAGRCRLHPAAALAILRRLENQNKVISRPLGPLTVWSLTPATREQLSNSSS